MDAALAAGLSLSKVLASKAVTNFADSAIDTFGDLFVGIFPPRSHREASEGRENSFLLTRFYDEMMHLITC